MAVLVVLAVAAVLADGAARSWAERTVAAQVRREAALPATPDVAFPAGSFLRQLLAGSFAHVDVTAAEATQQGLTAQDVQVRLRDVRVPRDVLLGRGGRVSAGGGTVRALLPYAALEQRTRAEGLDVRLGAAGQDLRATTELRALGRTLPLSLVLDPALDGDVLVLTPVSASAAGQEVGLAELRRLARAAGAGAAVERVVVPLPGLPAQVRPREVRVAAGGLLVTASVDPATLVLPPR
ncbi:hypothetical protein NUM3379_16400 [Kineococcus sp. NUM-3379]